MSCSTGLGDVVDEGAAWSSESVVECDGCGEREEACVDAGSESVEGAGAVAFEGEEVFAGLEDRLDALSDRRQMQPFAGFVFAAGPDDRGVEFGGGVFEGAAGVAFIADDGQVAVSLTRFSMARQTSRSDAFGEVSAKARGVPSNPNRACNRKPQK